MRVRFVTRIIVVSYFAIAVLCCDSWAEESARPNPYGGEWEIKEYSFQNRAAPQTIGGRFVIPMGSEKGALIANDGSKRSFSLIVRTPAPSTSIVQIEISKESDEVVHGGSGPRNGILRRLANGDLEIIETLSSSQPFPADFSAASKLKTRYYKLSAPKKKPATGS